MATELIKEEVQTEPVGSAKSHVSKNSFSRVVKIELRLQEIQREKKTQKSIIKEQKRNSSGQVDLRTLRLSPTNTAAVVCELM